MSKFNKRIGALLAAVVSLGVNFKAMATEQNVNSKGFAFADGKLHLKYTPNDGYWLDDFKLDEYKQIKGNLFDVYYLPEDGRVVMGNLLGIGDIKEDETPHICRIRENELKGKLGDAIKPHPLIKKLENVKRRGDKLFCLPSIENPDFSLLIQCSSDGKDKEIIGFSEHLDYYEKTLEVTRSYSPAEFKHCLKERKNQFWDRTTALFSTRNLLEFVAMADENIINWAKENELVGYKHKTDSASGSYGAGLALVGLLPIITLSLS